MEYQKVAFVGGGNIARALVGGLLAAAHKPQQILISEPDAVHRDSLASEFPGTVITDDNNEVVRRAGCVVLAVKPQVLSIVCKQVAASAQESRPLIISVAAGVRSGDIDTWLGGGLSIVRVMPNQPSLLGLGVSGLYANDRSSSEQRQSAIQIIATTGAVIELATETDIDTVTAVSGSGPAYFYLLIDMLVNAAQEMGLDRDSAHTLVIETARGAAEIAARSGESISALIDRVRSPGGTTAAALDYIDGTGFRDIFTAAVLAARDRATELADQAHDNSQD